MIGHAQLVNSRSAQRERFRQALRQARMDADLSQRAVARAVDRTPSAVWQWEEGRGAPDSATVAKLEQLLHLEPDTLGRLLGYAAPSDRPSGSVLDAVRADPRLDESGRELLSTVYRWLVRRESVGDGRS
jgi:transcriptional regulator with XRE-family HTH domain